MSFNSLNIAKDKLTYKLQRWQLTKVFSVTRKLEVKTAEKISNWEFTFDLHLDHVGMDRTNHLIKVSRKSFKINGKEPDYLVSRITNELQQSLYPIVFSVDVFGRATGIFNFNEIKANWKTKKLEVEQLHDGHGLNFIIDQMESHLENKEFFFEKMNNDTSLSGLFLPIYRNYGEIQTIDSEEFKVNLLGIDQLSFNGKLNYKQLNGVDFSYFKGNLILDESKELQLKNFIKIDSDESFQGMLTYERNSQSFPFLRQNIEIELQQGNDNFYRETIDYQFLRILK